METETEAKPTVPPAETTPTVPPTKTETKHTETDDVLAMLTEVAKTAVLGGQVSPAKITLMIMNTMVAIEKVQSMTGIQKKELVIHAVGDALRHFNAEADLVLAFNLMAPSVIDSLVAANRGKLLLKKVKETCHCVVC